MSSKRNDSGGEEPDPAFEALLEYIQEKRLFDFRGYKRSSLMRRVRKRMQEVEVESFEAYRDKHEVDPEEFTPLFNTILIKVILVMEEWRGASQTELREGDGD